MRSHWVLALWCAGVACSGGDPARSGLEETVQSRRQAEPVQAPAPEIAPPPDDPVPPPPEPSMLVQVRASLIGEAAAEDGQGGVVDSVQAVAVDLRSAGWPGEAMDPNLVIGDRTYTRYRHTSPVELRFVVDGPEHVSQGQVALLRYGTRVVAELELPAVEAP